MHDTKRRDFTVFNHDKLGVLLDLQRRALEWAARQLGFLFDALADRNPLVLETSATAAMVNMALPAGQPRNQIPLTRADGTPLWHLASVVDDLELGVNVIVRGTDKIDATGIQHRLRLLLGGEHSIAYLFLPKLREPGGTPVRVADLNAVPVRPSSIRWYLAEPYLTDGAPPQDFRCLLERLRPVLPAPRASYFDAARLAALDRKMSAVLNPHLAARELMRIVGTEHRDLVELVCVEQPRPLADQVAAYLSLKRQLVPPQPAALSGSARVPAPPATRTTAGPPIDR